MKQTVLQKADMQAFALYDDCITGFLQSSLQYGDVL